MVGKNLKGPNFFSKIGILSLTFQLLAWDPRGEVRVPEEKLAKPSFEQPIGEKVADREEAAKEEKNKIAVSSSQINYEKALAALQLGRREEALGILEQITQEGRDEFAKRSLMLLIRERASEGQINLENYSDLLTPQERTLALLAAADGYRLCQLKNPKEENCRQNEIRLLFEASTGEFSGEMLQARIRLAGLFLEQQRYSQARHILLPLFERGAETKIPWDLAWYYLAQALELDSQQRDLKRARQAYAKVLQFPASPYAERARRSLQRLERLYLDQQEP